MDGQHSELFLCVLQKLEQRAKKCIELRGECVEQIPSLVAVAFYRPGRAKDLSAPPCIKGTLHKVLSSYSSKLCPRTMILHVYSHFRVTAYIS